MESFDVCVIGAGYGGATAAALLAHSGRRVALVEKTNLAGGKTQTIDRKGYRFEMFGAVGIPAHNSRFHELVDLLDVGDRVQFAIPEGEVASVRYKAADGEWRTMYSALQQTGDPKEIDNLRRVFGATDDDLAAIAKLYTAVLTLEGAELDALDDVGMFDWMRPFGLPASLTSQICMNLNTLFVVPVNRLAASEAILTMRQQVLGGAGRYHVGGYGRVAEEWAASTSRRTTWPGWSPWSQAGRSPASATCSTPASSTPRSSPSSPTRAGWTTNASLAWRPATGPTCR
jgi:prolycopene isomerase